MQDEIRISLMATRQVMEDMLADSVLQQQLVKAVDCCVNALKSGGKLMFVGNGGSAAEASISRQRWWAAFWRSESLCHRSH